MDDRPKAGPQTWRSSMTRVDGALRLAAVVGSRHQDYLGFWAVELLTCSGAHPKDQVLER